MTATLSDCWSHPSSTRSSAMGRELPVVTLREFFVLATCYAGSTGCIRPKPYQIALLRKDSMRRLFALLPLLFALPMSMAAIPVDIHAPAHLRDCAHSKPCPVAILSPGYGLSGSDYSFVTDRLNAMGYLVVSLKDSGGGVVLDRDAPVSPQVQAMARVASR
jgi:hypothetical protein